MKPYKNHFMLKTITLLALSLSTLIIAGLQAKDAVEVDSSLLNLQRIFTDKDFKSESFGPIRWLEDGTGYTTLEDSVEFKELEGEAKAGEVEEDEAEDDEAEDDDDDDEPFKDIVKSDPATGESQIIVSARKLIPDGEEEPLEIKDYSWSKDATKLLIYTNSVKVWRKETRGDYWLYEMASGSLRKLGGDAEESRMMFAKFNPDGNRVAYVYQRDIYIQNLETMGISQLTHSGSDLIINGTADWVYEEEFGLRDGFSFSPDGQFIAYWNFDTEGVEEFQLVNYTEERYPKIKSYQYPKVGHLNSACRVGVVSVTGGSTQWLDTGDDLRENYIPKMSWIPDTNKLVLQRMNRLQNRNKLMVSSVSKGFLGGVKATPLDTIITEEDDAWIDINSDLKWVKGGSRFTWTSDRDGWRHLYLISGEGEKVELLTPGEFDVISVLKVDDEGGWIYYIASPENATRKFLYRASMNVIGKNERLTPLNQPGHHSYDISEDAKWAIHTYSTLNTPSRIDMVSLPDHQQVRILEANTELHSKIGELKIGSAEFFRVEVADGVELDGWCYKPSHFDPKKKYPLFVYVYGEPAAQTVMDRWGGEKGLWHRMIAEQGYIVVSMDNRGTPAPRGRGWRKSVYRQIGILASADQAAGVRKIIDTWPYIDSKRIGVWGWSGGGSMTLNALFRYPDLYHTGMAIAFISDQLNYDTIYQERFMGLPDDNPEGFKNGSPITFAKQLEGNLLIVYGTGDDNCHYQNCQVLANELIKHNKPFSMMSYPNRSHAIKEGKGTRRHLYELFTRYLNGNLPAGGH